MVHIRPARASDTPTIKRMVRQARLDPTSLKWQHFLIAEDEASGETLGIGQVKVYPGCEELGSLVVTPQHQGEGIGAALIAALEAQAGRPLYLLCTHLMAPYYLRFGYQTIPWRAAPWFLKLKTAPAPLIGLAFGVKLRIMVKTA